MTRLDTLTRLARHCRSRQFELSPVCCPVCSRALTAVQGHRGPVWTCSCDRSPSKTASHTRRQAQELAAAGLLLSCAHA